jgi:signal transduction histidine kinase
LFLQASTAQAVSSATVPVLQPRPSDLALLARPHPLITAEGPTALVLDRGWAKTYEVVWSIPLLMDGEHLGVMQFAFDRQVEWLPRDEDFLTAAGERCLVAAEKQRLVEHLAAREQQIRDLAERMLHVEEEERRRISRELHDEAGQSLVCIRLQIEMLEQSLPEDAAEWRSKLAEARDLTEKTILDMRRLIADLSPAVLEQLGLGAALRQLVTRFRRSYPCQVNLKIGNFDGLPKKLEIIVYRLVQECCTNIAKHSSATRVNILVSSADGVLRLQVRDNGVGFKMADRKESFGLSGIRERVALLGGKFEAVSYPRNGGDTNKARRTGTEIRIELPIALEEKD